MSRLCRLKTKTYGEDGQLAYEEITKLREQVAAQAAVIETLTKRLASTNIIMEVVCAIHPDSACAKYELAENMNALALLTDSTQILAGVRRAERERCAKVCEDFAYQHPNTHMLGPELNRLDCAKLIRAME